MPGPVLMVKSGGETAGVGMEGPRPPGETDASTTWPRADLAESGLDREALAALAKLVEGAGFVVKDGRAVYRWGYDHRSRDVASVKKSFISVLNLLAVERGFLGDLDQPVAEREPRLLELNEGKDAAITWRHLACMTSGYGLSEAPGQAFAYNDFAVALWYDTLMRGVFREPGTTVLRREIAEPLGFEDPVTFRATGEDAPEPKLRISARDLARFGQMLLQEGRWQERRILSGSSWREIAASVVPVDLPLSAGIEAAMIPGQKSVGGHQNMSPIGPGNYSFHLWMNLCGRDGRLMLPDAPEDTMLASGKWGEAALWVIPSLGLVVAWNDSDIGDHHLADALPEADMNKAARLIVQACEAGSR